MRSAARIFPAGLLLTAMWFLFNPNISILDPLPDCIGYLLIMYALRHVTTFVPYMREASDGFRKLFYANFIKIPAFFIVLTLSSERVTVTLFSFSFAIVELLFAIPAFRNLFEGLFYLGERFGCTSTIRRKATMITPEALRVLTYVFLSVKAALSALPDLAFLPSYDPLTGKGFTVSTTQYLVILTIAFLLAFAMGIVWISYIRPYLKAVAEDHAVKGLSPAIGGDLPLRESRRLRLSLPYFLFAAAICLSVDLVFDNVLVPPDYLGAALFLALALLLFLTEERKNYLPLALSGAHLAATVLFAVFRARFFEDYAITSLTYNQNADRAYLPVLLCACLSEVLFAANVLVLGRELVAFRHKNTQKLPDATTYEGRLLAAEEREEARQNRVCAILAIASALTSAVEVFLARYNEPVQMQPGYGNAAFYIPVFAGFWILPLLLSVALSVDAVYLASLRTKKLWRENEAEIPEDLRNGL